MTPAIVVSNASPLIALAQIHRLDLLTTLFGNVTIPPAVAMEIAPSVPVQAWLKSTPLHNPTNVQQFRTRLGAGESAAIALALELDAGWLLLDDRAARRAAQSLHLPVIGTLSILTAARRRGLIPSLHQAFDELLAVHFHASADLMNALLEAVGESRRY